MPPSMVRRGRFFIGFLDTPFCTIRSKDIDIDVDVDIDVDFHTTPCQNQNEAQIRLNSGLSGPYVGFGVVWKSTSISTSTSTSISLSLSISIELMVYKRVSKKPMTFVLGLRPLVGPCHDENARCRGCTGLRKYKISGPILLMSRHLQQQIPQTYPNTILWASTPHWAGADLGMEGQNKLMTCQRPSRRAASRC